MITTYTGTPFRFRRKMLATVIHFNTLYRDQPDILYSMTWRDE